MRRFRPMVSRRSPSGTHFAELYLTPGPQEIGVTGDNSYEALYGSEWLFMIEDATRLLRAYQKFDSVWVERTTDPRMPPIVGQEMDASVRRLSGTFDQSARAVIAYEVGEGVVTGTRWDPTLGEYKQNIDFSGTDPCVVIDAWWSGDIPQSDVLVFYLSPDRQRVCCRAQRDLYAVEHELWTFDEPVILDRVVAAPIRYQVLISDEEGTPLPDALISDPYPYLAFDQMQASGTAVPSAGDYAPIVIPYDMHELLPVSGTAVPTSGGYLDPIMSVEVGGEQIAVAGQVTPSGGTFQPAILEASVGGEQLTGAGQVTPSGGEYVLVTINYLAPSDSLAVGGQVLPSGGSYDPA